MVYGPEDYQNRTASYVRRMVDDRKAILLPKEQACWYGLRAYVEDVADAILKCTVDQRPGNYIYNVADEVCLTERQWLERTAKAFGWNGEIIETPMAEMPKHLQDDTHWEQDWSLDSSRIRRELGYHEVVDPAVAMKKTVVWQRENLPESANPAEGDYIAEDAAVNGIRDTGC